LRRKLGRSNTVDSLNLARMLYSTVTTSPVKEVPGHSAYVAKKHSGDRRDRRFFESTP